MQRLNLDQEHIDSLAMREYEAGISQDEDLPEDARRSRVDLDDTTTNLTPDGSVKRGDDVQLWNWLEGRVVGPARGVNMIQVHVPDASDQMGDIVTAGLDAVTDRAPINVGETAMPVIEAPPEPEPLPIDFASLRMAAFQKIDQRSDALIAAGFEFGGSVFSCSLEAQIRMNAMLMLAANFTYPMEINALDDQSKGILATPQDTQLWCMTALGHIKAVVDSGTVEKDRIRDTEDIAFIVNYEDPRPLPTVNPYVPENPASAPEAPEEA